MTTAVDWSEVASVLDDLYSSVAWLEALFPGRRFTPDGHLVGSIGEVVAAYMFDLDLHVASNKGHDAIAPDGRAVEIKLTQGRNVSIREQPDHLIVLQRPRSGSVRLVYNGPGVPAWQNAGKMQSNGQRSISLTKLSSLDEQVDDRDRLRVIRSAPI